MSQHLIPWATGGGNIVVDYTGSGNETVTISSDRDNLGEDRSQTLTFTTTGSNPATASVTIVQPTGMQVLVTSDGDTLRDADGFVLRVYPEGYLPT